MEKKSIILRIAINLLLIAMPFLLMELITTRSEIEYSLFENIVGHIAVFILGFTHAVGCTAIVWGARFVFYPMKLDFK